MFVYCNQFGIEKEGESLTVAGKQSDNISASRKDDTLAATSTGQKLAKKVQKPANLSNGGRGSPSKSH